MCETSIIVPTRGPRHPYLTVALASVAPQAAAAGAEIVVVTDGPGDAATAELAAGHGAHYAALGAQRGINVARNAGIDASRGELICFLDDDVRVWPGWLGALIAAAADYSGHEAFGGPVQPLLEHGRLRSCGREPLPITALDLGPNDRDAERLWGANLAIRRAAVARIGHFDPELNWAGDEEEWEERLLASGGRMRYIAAAGVDHRRDGRDARLRNLSRAAYHRGRAARRYDRRRGVEPGPRAEARTLAGCCWHAVRRGCAYGVVMAAHSLGRTLELAHPTQLAAGTGGPRAEPSAERMPDIFSGESGTLNRRSALAGGIRDAAEDLLMLAPRLALQRAARGAEPQRVLVLAVVRPEHAGSAAAAARELERSRGHDVTIRLVAPEPGAGKWINLDRGLRATPAEEFDWLIVLDDDVVLPAGFLDAFLFCCQRFGLRLAQPAHRHRSHAAWRVTRRRPWTTARRTAFVEIGPVTALHRTTFPALLPFPSLQMGWGLDAHWSAVAARQGWPLGVVDATPIRHVRPVAATYDRAGAELEARRFLADRPYVDSQAAQRTLATHRWW